MTIAILRIIFDRSAFHNPGFRQLSESRLSELCRSGRMKVFLTPTFLEETVATYGAAERATDWANHLEYALEICNGGIFLPKEAIWREELVAGRGTFAGHLVPKRQTKRHNSLPRLIEQLGEIARSGDFSHQWLATEAERKDHREKRKTQREILVDARIKVGKERKERHITEPLNAYSYEQFRDSIFLDVGRNLMDLVSARRTAALGDQWARQPQRIPFYSGFVEGVVYAGYHATIRHNEPIDENTQPDYEQLAYLTWADIVVSNDRRFFRQAFEAIWKPRGKRLETTESFVALVDRLAPSIGPVGNR